MTFDLSRHLFYCQLKVLLLFGESKNGFLLFLQEVSASRRFKMWGFTGKITSAVICCPFRGGFGALIFV